MTQEEKDTALFASLVMMFQSATMQHLGKVKNAVTDEVERDLSQAQVTIDMLDMIAAKTRGNLAEDEARFLKNVIHELKLNFVDEKSKDQSKEKESK